MTKLTALTDQRLKLFDHYLSEMVRLHPSLEVRIAEGDSGLVTYVIWHDPKNWCGGAL